MIRLFLYAGRTLGLMANTLRERREPGSNLFFGRVPIYASFSLTVLALIIPPAYASADTYQLICENPRREYTVSFSDGDTNLQVGVTEGVTHYRVLAIEKTAERHIVVALTINDGPTVRLSLRPYRRMEFWSGNQLFQTDACRSS